MRVNSDFLPVCTTARAIRGLQLNGRPCQDDFGQTHLSTLWISKTNFCCLPTWVGNSGIAFWTTLEHSGKHDTQYICTYQSYLCTLLARPGSRDSGIERIQDFANTSSNTFGFSVLAFYIKGCQIIAKFINRLKY